MVYSVYIYYPFYMAGLCSNAFASANSAFALAFDCPVVDAFALDSSAFALDSNAFALDSNAFDWNQMRIKLDCFIVFILLVSSGISLRKISMKTFDCSA